ncbi:MAG: thioredoxin family protein [Rhodocyclaceae bacterium]|nr:thioredoxin family protein [Rhodocyclaceae bacterium]
MTTRVRTLLNQALFCCALLFSANLLAAADHAKTEQVAVRLIPNTTSVSAGSEVLIGLEQTIIPHWHTYWQNPGDSGVATQIEWQLPQGVTAGPIQWPLPSRFKLGTITNYGYSDKVTLLSTISIPKTAKVGSQLPIRAKASWLVCEEVCIPQQAELALTLTVSAANNNSAPHPSISQALAQLPQPSPWSAAFNQADGKVQLSIASPELQTHKLKDVWFYPHTWGHIDHGAAQDIQSDGKGLILNLKVGESPIKADATLSGVLVFTEQTPDGPATRGFTLQAQPGIQSTNNTDPIGLFASMLFALLGGLILNLMPCVFPVLSIKALSLVRHGAHASRETRLHGLAYTVGILASFLLLAAILLVLRNGGAQIGWGYQFQSPTFVLITAYLMFAIGLSLSGVFVLGTSITQLGEGLTAKPGYSGSFFTGVLATVVATPCTAPFMGAAIGYALTQPPLPLLAVFSSLGLGLALPYLLLSNWPLLQRCLPKPGLWMERLKQFFAFPMYATAVWLVWVLTQQAGPDSLILALGGMVIIAFAAWLFDSTRSTSGWKRPLTTVLAASLVGATLLVSYLNLQHSNVPSPSSDASAAKHWEPYSAERLQALRAEGKPVFLNFTAAWCITCLANERIALSQQSVIDAFKQNNITYLKGDWTNQDAAITGKLAEFGRTGVPLYVLYPAGENKVPIVLPQILTPEIVLDHIRSSH